MKINILVSGGIYATQSGYSALQFCRSALAAGHTINQVFFYQDGVTQATYLSVPLGDEFDAPQAWAQFSKEAGVDLVVCVSAAERRGIVSKQQAAEFSLSASSLHPQFRIEGLGSLHDATLAADRLVSFK